MNSWWIYGIGFLAQILFSARLFIQWIASERAKRVLSPVIFWQLSMVASFLLCLYGWLRNDFAIIVGQFISYYIYIWNLKTQQVWNKLISPLRFVFMFMPIIAIAWFLWDWRDIRVHLFAQENIPMWLIIFGIGGQFTFTLRFIYQWWYSRKVGESLLPLNFWLISLLGSSMIVIYAIIRHDPVLVVGQSTGMIIYARNIYLSLKPG
ncbi:lipid-A-disaccharide synthase N-terminal domain-containing protein [Parabacteroides pacaensis]|uniref:lipid-A-disaccharide synthase N-terminal domain-containing protein n=1 Tax=Parabacteroides pacaensis TaxID=2086575 RepID=UPI000D114678|nr:lipid-A-disaccharide synthase N-terminal domain-containing protein [Parabacteroides pacaensis]